jgi:hypothetical protein
VEKQQKNSHRARSEQRGDSRYLHILAVAELKMQDHGCGSFSVDTDEPSRANSVTEGHTQGPVAQVIMYNLAQVWRGRVAFGLPVPKRIASAVVVG